MKIITSKRNILSNKNNYLYFTKHGIGPGTLPRDVKLVDWRDIDDNVTAIWLDRFLTTEELNQYDIYSETSDQYKLYSKKLNSCIVTASNADDFWYEDPQGILGKPGEKYTENDLLQIYESGKRNDPVIDTYPSFQAWLYDTTRWLEEYESDNKVFMSKQDNFYQHFYVYKYKGKYKFSIHYDDVIDIEDPELSFKQFRASISVIKPYDDADYAWARIQKGSIDYFMEGKLAKKEYYFMFSDYGTDEDPLYENANEWIADIIDRTCDILIKLNQNVEPRIIHNSTSIKCSYDADYVRMRKTYPNQSVFKDRDKESGKIKDLTDDLDNKSVAYEIYYNKTDKGCTVFFDNVDSVHASTDDNTNDLSNIWMKLAQKSVIDSDGFYTDYTLYTDGDIYICILGDNELYEPNIDYADYETDDEESAWNWFNAYEGFSDNDSIESSSDLSTDAEEDQFSVEDTEQEYTSENTSINKTKLPAVYNLVKFKPGSLVLDFGGGKWDAAVEHFAKENITILVYDPYNRSAEHNEEVIRILREHGGADAAVNSNVLNVIKEPEARETVLRNIKRLTKKGAPIYITVYEGRGDKQEGPTKSGYQLNRKTADYMEEIQNVFDNVTRKGKLITAINASEKLSTSDIDDILDDLKTDLQYDIIDTMISEEFGFNEEEAKEYTRIDVIPDPDYDGITIEVGAGLSYEGLDKLREVLDQRLNYYVKNAYFDIADLGLLETYFAASQIIPDSIKSCQTIEAGYYDVPERPLNPPEYNEGEELNTEAIIEIPFNQIITIKQDGSWDYSDDEYNFTKTEDGKSIHRDENYHIYLDDNVGVLEKLDDFLYDKLPETPGTYRIQGDLTLVYDIGNIIEYSNNDGYWSEEEGDVEPSYEVYTDDAEATYNKSKSSLNNFRYTKLK